MLDVTQGRPRQCKDSIGGIKKFFLANYVEHARNEIITQGVFLLDIPPSLMHEFVPSNDPGMRENQNENEGGKFVEMSIDLDLPLMFDHFEISQLVGKEYRILIKDELDNWRIFGLFNGMSLDSMTAVTGGAKPDFNGFQLSFSGEEEDFGYFLGDPTSPDPGDPPGVGFVFGRLLLETGDFVLLEDGGKIFL